MQDPSKDIQDVVKLVTAAANADIQKEAVFRCDYLLKRCCSAQQTAAGTMRQTRPSVTRFAESGRVLDPAMPSSAFYSERPRMVALWPSV